MAEDWAIDVKKYDPGADDGAIKAIVNYCGIALRSRDASLVSFSDRAETDLVRENYLKKKLGLTDPDSDLDSAIAAIGTQMKGDTTRNRVTVYYLLARHFGKLGFFGATDASVVPPVVTAPLPVMAPVDPYVAAMPVAAAAPVMTAKTRGIAEWLPMAVLLLGGLALLWYLTHKKPMPTPPAPVAVAAPVAVVPATPVPTGADVVATVVDDEPMVSVYFDTAKSDIAPDFDAKTAELRSYFAAHPDEHLQVSGYNDPRGDALMNAELSKNRAFVVRDALARLGVAVSAIALVKPVNTTDDATSMENARRVDVTVEGGPVPAAEADTAKP